jgi:chlorophyll synthase
MMPTLIRKPREKAPLYNATGTTFYVLGMLASAFAIRQVLLA